MMVCYKEYIENDTEWCLGLDEGVKGDFYKKKYKSTKKSSVIKPV
jgi:hypothetical protein